MICWAMAFSMWTGIDGCSRGRRPQKSSGWGWRVSVYVHVSDYSQFYFNIFSRLLPSLRFQCETISRVYTHDFR